jgi:hypothetical protein
MDSFVHAGMQPVGWAEERGPTWRRGLLADCWASCVGPTYGLQLSAEGAVLKNIK